LIALCEQIGSVVVTNLLRFRDLKARGIANSWTMLKLRIERDGFPPGRMIGPNSRAWSEEEIDQWFKSRPIAGPGAPRGAAKRNRDRKAAAGADITVTTAA
jgi:predicted DNA-binding transcriptional regulator AlpA